MTDNGKSFNDKFEQEYPDTDLYCYFGPIHRPFDDKVIKNLRERKKKKNIMVFMTTAGGNPDAAYRIARAIQREYGLEAKQEGKDELERTERCFFLFVDSLCLSAGTLIALGATHLLLSDYAELGPLDVQIGRPVD